METDRLRWFLAVTARGGIRDAAARLHVSPGAVSKAMTDLEATLGRRLFVRSKRGFSLTEGGEFLRAHALELLRLEDDLVDGLSGGEASRRLLLFGTEPLVALHFAEVLQIVAKRFPDATLEVRVTKDDGETRAAFADETSGLGVVSEVSRAEPSRKLTRAPFGTYVGLTHPLASRAIAGVPVEEVIAFAFMVPEREVFGVMGKAMSHDGWRDDMFPRKKRIPASTLAVVQACIEAGHAIAYVPVALAERMRAVKVKVTGCPYSCTCEANLVRPGSARGWVRQVL